ncbi:tetratricopeptide repeat protein [Anaerobiospirillum sp. NML120449]|uniref:tetratricopeptide repeat protein n=1 Tax=Anaerobiospirillum sp. NML120449 TaxID=2932817 RepID=UPI001FF1B02D|nr:tetratricopeptide repeat protein [Anaerobiospirillum sp. NML120449]MCK0527603.1 sel1 repeat family protein [Anaerobiospirillum sp. NML120449]
MSGIKTAPNSNGLRTSLLVLGLCSVISGAAISGVAHAGTGLKNPANVQPEKIISQIEANLADPEHMKKMQRQVELNDQRLLGSASLSRQTNEAGDAHSHDGKAVLETAEIKKLTSKCEGANDLEACQRLGIHYSSLAIDHNTDIDINMKLAAFNLEKACTGGLKTACTVWGHALGMYGNYFVDDRSPKQDYSYGYKLLSHSCELDDPFGCTMSGLMLFQGRGVEKDQNAARGMFTRACDLALAKPDYVRKSESNLGMGCYYAGRLVALEHNTASKDPKSNVIPADSVSYYEKGCELNSPDACMDLANYYTAAGDGTRAIEFSQRACFAGNSSVCLANAVQLHNQGDDASANRFLDAGCQMGNGDACTLYASNMLSGIAMKQDTSTAIAMLEQACKINNGLSCMYLGRLCETGGAEVPNYSTPVNLDHASIYYARACNLGIAAACESQNNVEALRAASLRNNSSTPVPPPPPLGR